jgi:aspartate kinase
LKEEYFVSLLNRLNENYKTKHNSDLTLVTIRHYSTGTIKELTDGKTVLLEQISRNTAQMVLK